MPAKTPPPDAPLDLDRELQIARLEDALRTEHHSVLHIGGGQLVFITTGENEGSGWAGFFPDDRRPSTFLRFVARASGDEHLKAGALFYDIVELYLADSDGITGRDLRALPLGQIEAAVNQRANAERMARYANRSDGGLGIGFNQTLAELAEDKPKLRRPRMRVPVPAGAKKPDSFYEQIAYRYGWLQAEGVRSPAEELAEANHVPTSTVHRWIKEARRRGVMAPGQRASRGRAS
ncbi:MAG: hypothetical protein NVS3B18_01690 [Candidatus Dormibacteria bacterium]